MRFVWDQCDNRALQPQIVEHAAQPAVMPFIRGIEHRHFNAVEAGCLDRLQQRHMLFADMPGPQQQVHANFHARQTFRLPRSSSHTTPKMKHSTTGITATVWNEACAAEASLPPTASLAWS